MPYQVFHSSMEPTIQATPDRITRGRYPRFLLTDAIKAALSGKMTVVQAAAAFGIPRSTLQKHVVRSRAEHYRFVYGEQKSSTSVTPPSHTSVNLKIRPPTERLGSMAQKLDNLEIFAPEESPFVAEECEIETEEATESSLFDEIVDVEGDGESAQKSSNIIDRSDEVSVDLMMNADTSENNSTRVVVESREELEKVLQRLPPHTRPGNHVCKVIVKNIHGDIIREMASRKVAEAFRPDQFPLVLYKRILRLHYGLPAPIRLVGDTYVKDEFRRHKTADEQHVKPFLNEWTNYCVVLSKQLSTSGIVKGFLGAELKPDMLDSFAEEQLRQLLELKVSAETEAKDMSSDPAQSA